MLKLLLYSFESRDSSKNSFWLSAWLPEAFNNGIERHILSQKNLDAVQKAELCSFVWSISDGKQFFVSWNLQPIFLLFFVHCFEYIHVVQNLLSTDFRWNTASCRQANLPHIARVRHLRISFESHFVLFHSCRLRSQCPAGRDAAGMWFLVSRS